VNVSAEEADAIVEEIAEAFFRLSQRGIHVEMPSVIEIDGEEFAVEEHL
jgi:hypothetical protein